jgi:hypothetical protein
LTDGLNCLSVLWKLHATIFFRLSHLSSDPFQKFEKLLIQLL